MSSRRHQAREVVLQMLFQKDLNPDVSADMIREQMQEMLVCLEFVFRDG